MPSKKVLIVGSGVAGSVLAFNLAKHDFQITVIERSRAEQKAGQGIEIEEPALQVVKEMGILDELEAKKTCETGFRLVDEHSNSAAVFEVGGFSPTGALELMRGDLTEILYKAADRFPNVTYHFETTIRSITQAKDRVTAEFQRRGDNTTTTEVFDFVIGADGVKSRTRHLVMGAPESLGCFKPVGAFVAYFSVPEEKQDGPLSRACNFPNRRVAWLRPISKDSDLTSVYLVHVADDVPGLREANAAGDRQRQKECLAKTFDGLGWEMPRVIEKMQTAENFYSDELAQVKLDRWSVERVALVGDAAWAPTPFTGQGNQLAIIGAWVLAQEMARDASPSAFAAYDKRLRKYVEDGQSIPIGGYAPYMVSPETKYGIWFFRKVLGLISWTYNMAAWSGLLRLLPDGPHDDFDLQIGKSKDL